MSKVKLQLPSCIADSDGSVLYAGPSDIENGINLLGPRAGLRCTPGRTPEAHAAGLYWCS